MKASVWTLLWTLGAVKAWSRWELTTIVMYEMRRILLVSFHMLDIEKSRGWEQVMQKSLQPWGDGLAQNRSALICNSLQAGTWSFGDPNGSRICICFSLCLHKFQGLPRDPHSSFLCNKEVLNYFNKTRTCTGVQASIPPIHNIPGITSEFSRAG